MAEVEFRIKEEGNGAPNGSQKLTNWEIEPQLKDLKMDVQAARQAHDGQMAKIAGWNDLLFVRGKYKPKVNKGRSGVQPKLIRRQAEWRYSALTEPFLGSDKLYKISPVTFEDELGAKQNELVLNYQFRTKINRIKFIDDYVRSVVDDGTAVLRVGWKRETVKVKEMAPRFDFFAITDQEQSKLLMQAIELKSANPRQYMETVPPEVQQSVDYYDETQVPTYAVQNGEEEIEVEKVIQNAPVVEVKDPKNVIIDPSCNGDIEKAMFACETFETCKADLVKEGRYKNLDQVNWSSAVPLSTEEHTSQTPIEYNLRDEARKRGVAYEYWGFVDIEGNDKLTPIVVTWIGNTIIRMEKSPHPDGKLPYIVVPYLPKKRELYGETDAELLEDNQAILGAVSRGMIDMLGRSANGQLGFAKGMLDPLNRRRFDTGADYEFNPNVPINMGLIEHKYPEFPSSAMNMLNLQNVEAESLTGVKSFSGGISGEAYGEVAAGIRGVLDAASKREMAILRRISKGIAEMGTKIISMNQVFLSEEETVRVTNREFVKIRREDLQGNFDLIVDISTAEVDNQKAQDMGFMLQTMGPNMDPAVSRMILADIADLKRMPKLAEDIRTYKPEPDPLEEKRKELEIAKLEAQIAQIKAAAALSDAKAAEARAKADQLDLDYIEQETGTAHERDMEKQRGQAQGNQELEVTKAIVKTRKPDESEPNIDAAIGFNEISRKSKDVRGRGQEDSLPLPIASEAVDTNLEREEIASEDPRYSIGSRFYDPDLDPASNPNINI